MNIASICFFTFLPVSVAAPHPPLQEITITVPQGTSNHSDPRLLCTPADGYDIALFMFGNYAAHVATIVTLPGETLGSIFLTMIFALIFPMTGIQKCIRLLGKHTLLRRKQCPLKNALRAGALCELVRTSSWKPVPGNKICNVKVTGLPAPQEYQGPNAVSRPDIELQRIDNQAGEPAYQSSTTDTVPDPQEGPAGEETCHAETSHNTGQSDAIELHPDHNRTAAPDERPQFAYSIEEVERFSSAKNTFQFRGRAIHGRCSIPSGYALSILPANATVCPISEISDLAHSSDLSSSYNIGGIFAAIFQLFYGSFTLYRTRGNQIEQYGFSAFGLTVTPYVIMSFMNLLTLAVTPSYAKLYLVNTSVMEEARLRGGFFEGEVGKIAEETPGPASDERSMRFIAWVAQFIRTHLPWIWVETKSKKEITTSGDIEFEGHEASVAKFTSVGPEPRAILDLNVDGPATIREQKMEESSTQQLVEIPASPIFRPASRLRRNQKYFFIFLSIILNSLSLVVIGCLSHFKPIGGGIILIEVMILVWILGCIIYGATFVLAFDSVSYRVFSKHPFVWYKDFDLCSRVGVACAIFIGGVYLTVHAFIIVCLEILEYGSCVRLY